jgi:hypothetical protein
MRRKWGRSVVVVLILGLLVALTASDVFAAKQKKTVTGVVKRAEVYAGKVRAVYIEEAEGGEYLVLRGTEVGKELIEQVGATLSATGYIRKATRDPEFELIIDVLEYEIHTPRKEPAPKAKKDPAR